MVYQTDFTKSLRKKKPYKENMVMRHTTKKFEEEKWERKRETHVPT